MVVTANLPWQPFHGCHAPKLRGPPASASSPQHLGSHIGALSAVERRRRALAGDAGSVAPVAAATAAQGASQESAPVERRRRSLRTVRAKHPEGTSFSTALEAAARGRAELLVGQRRVGSAPARRELLFQGPAQPGKDPDQVSAWLKGRHAFVGVPRSSCEASGLRGVARRHPSKCAPGLFEFAKNPATPIVVGNAPHNAGQQETEDEERASFQASLESRFAALDSQGTGPAEADLEWLQRAMMQRDLSSSLRARAILGVSRLLAARRDCQKGAVAAPDTLELEGALSEGKGFLLESPTVAAEIAIICDEQLGLTAIADSLYEELEREALRIETDSHHPYQYLFVDLAEWCRRRGQHERSRALLLRARAVPPAERDPRTVTRHFGWHFEAQPDVPHDKLRVAAPPPSAELVSRVKPSFKSCVLGCKCPKHAIGRSDTVVESERGDEEPEHVGDDGKSASSDDNSSIHAMPRDMYASSYECPDHVRCVLDASFNLAPGLAAHAAMRSPAMPSCHRNGCKEDASLHRKDDQEDASHRLATSVALARRITAARRFKLRVLDTAFDDSESECVTLSRFDSV